MMDDWSDIPEQLWVALLESTDPEISEYMQEFHTCIFGHVGSKVNACDRLAEPGSEFCSWHNVW